jgi:hypothetical protein
MATDRGYPVGWAGNDFGLSRGSTRGRIVRRWTETWVGPADTHGVLAGMCR